MGAKIIYHCDICDLGFDQEIPSIGGRGCGRWLMVCAACAGKISVKELAAKLSIVIPDPKPVTIS